MLHLREHVAWSRMPRVAGDDAMRDTELIELYREAIEKVSRVVLGPRLVNRHVDVVLRQEGQSDSGLHVTPRTYRAM